MAKAAMEFTPPSALLLLGEVMRGGAAKYGKFNWHDNAVAASVYYNAAHRHLMAWYGGQDLDPESGAPHLAHVMACCCIILDADLTEMLVDDRPFDEGKAIVLALQMVENARRATGS